ncbi:type III secretion system gatekeeper subunit SctW [Thalassomonas viridans]|uniref:Type III secretion system gatekeeper subunit SctW n=1 Tax=Thalassomonas viridans TaxID=137584 RepID=A0AAE9Z9N8_9GAMM|nr:type III secretion system gatekeeper subunit SctW [Thalassomonas viridans]WDE08679.1 type III secretion system gatekeeper subunit SctW [Thalassomonas viridans]
MTDSLAVATVAKHMAQINMGSEASQAMRGQLRGEHLVLLPPSQLSLFEAAQEELSFAVADRVGKGLKKRKFHAETRIKTQLIEQADSYLKKVPDLDKQHKLKRFIRQILSNPYQGATELKEHAGRMYHDPSLQYAAIAEAMSILGEGPQAQKLHSSLLGQLSIAAEQLMQEQGQAIRAGLNVSETAAEFSRSDQGIQTLRSFYRDAILDYQNVTQGFHQIVKRFGEKGFAKSLAFLLQALGADLKAKGPSIEPRQLRLIINDMYIIKTLGGILEQTRELIDTLRRHYRQRKVKNGLFLMEKMLDLKSESFPKPELFLKLNLDMNVIGLANQIYFTQELIRLLRQIPDKAYQEDLDAKRELLHMAQLAVDNLIKQEEEEEEEEELEEQEEEEQEEEA